MVNAVMADHCNRNPSLSAIRQHYFDRRSSLIEASSFFLRPGVRTAAVVYIIMVGAVYAILLSNLYHWTGLMLVANRILHVALPILYPLYWLAFIETGRVK
jgi:hypothetical protein